MENDPNHRNANVYSTKVKAGRKRTYFFDVVTTRASDYYITITESTRRADGNGYSRHQIFLYKEDFNRFVESLQNAVDHIKTELMPDFDYDQFAHRDDHFEIGDHGDHSKQEGVNESEKASPEKDKSENDNMNW